MNDAIPIYLDHAAATPTDENVLSKMLPFFSDNFYNASATYQNGLDAHKALNAARVDIAHWFGARPSEIIFTAGGSESNNLAIHGIMRQYPEAHVIVSGVEHESVLAPARRYDFSEAPVDKQGVIDLQKLEALITGKTVLISVMQANNEVGTIQPVRLVSQLVATVRKQRLAQGNTLPLYLHTDACQAVNYLDIHVTRLGADLITINGSKIYGPKQSGVLYVKGGVLLQPLIDGGGQERGLRSGTENIAAAVGLAEALTQAQTIRQQEGRRLQALQKFFVQELTQAIPSAIINGSTKSRLPNNVHCTMPGTDNERVLILLDQAGVQAAAGSACSASSEESSHVLKAMGLSDQEARSSLRFTMGRATTQQQVRQAVEALKTITANEHSR